MGRRRCCRWIGMNPRVERFVPADGVASEGEVCLTRDELESLRLADLSAMHQDAAAAEMGVSRATFGRIVDSARMKVADALVNGRAIRIEGGEVRLRASGRRCGRCGCTWVGSVDAFGECPRCHCKVGNSGCHGKGANDGCCEDRGGDR